MNVSQKVFLANQRSKSCLAFAARYTCETYMTAVINLLVIS